MKKNMISMFLILYCLIEIAICKEPSKYNKDDSIALIDNIKDDSTLFRSFSVEFFKAVKNSDIVFLKNHIKFPILNSSFHIFDNNLSEGEKIDSKLLFKKLKQFFPESLMSEISDAEYGISKHEAVTTQYVITYYDESGEVEGNYTWIFIKTSKSFCFINFRAEAG